MFKTVGNWRQYLCEILRHKREWRQRDDIRVLYCPTCNVVLDVQRNIEGEWV